MLVRVPGFLVSYFGSSDFEPQIIMKRTATECAMLLGLKLCDVPGCPEHSSTGPHCHIPESKFGAVEKFSGNQPSRADLAGQEFRLFAVNGVEVFWFLEDSEEPPLIYFRLVKFVA